MNLYTKYKLRFKSRTAKWSHEDMPPLPADLHVDLEPVQRRMNHKFFLPRSRFRFVSNYERREVPAPIQR